MLYNPHTGRRIKNDQHPKPGTAKIYFAGNILTARDVILYPDLGCYEKWQDKSKLLQALTHSFKISNLLEQHATENDKKNGLDIADYFIQRDMNYG